MAYKRPRNCPAREANMNGPAGVELRLTRSHIVVEINARRRALMKGIVDFLTELRQGYIVGRNGFDFECSSMHLGALMKGLHALKFVDENPPDAPFGDLSLMEVVEKLQKSNLPPGEETDPEVMKKLLGRYNRVIVLV